jgi:hypothetical protein
VAFKILSVKGGKLGQRLQSLFIGGNWQENCKLGVQFMQNSLLKDPMSLCNSCRGTLDLQLYLFALGVLQFKKLEIFAVK